MSIELDATALSLSFVALHLQQNQLIIVIKYWTNKFVLKFINAAFATAFRWVCMHLYASGRSALASN